MSQSSVKEIVGHYLDGYDIKDNIGITIKVKIQNIKIKIQTICIN